MGIVPLGGSAKITTEGLEWDVRDWETRFGGRVSTSNHIRARKVVVWTDERVLFMVEVGEGAR